jgi:F-type H+-transporting ATPase subunit alpha
MEILDKIEKNKELDVETEKQLIAAIISFKNNGTY